MQGKVEIANSWVFGSYFCRARRFSEIGDLKQQNQFLVAMGAMFYIMGGLWFGLQRFGFPTFWAIIVFR